MSEHCTEEGCTELVFGESVTGIINMPEDEDGFAWVSEGRCLQHLREAE